MARITKLNHDADRAALQAAKPSTDALRNVDGELMNPYSYGTPCYWAWHGANIARQEITRDG
jgi:hypothetical protein